MSDRNGDVQKRAETAVMAAAMTFQGTGVPANMIITEAEKLLTWIEQKSPRY